MHVSQQAVGFPHPVLLSVPFGIRVLQRMAPVRLAFARFAPLRSASTRHALLRLALFKFAFAASAPVRLAPPRLQLGQAAFCSALDALRSHLARLALGPTMQGEPG